MAEAFLVDAIRTPMGAYRGALSGVRPDDLAAHVIRAVVERTGVDPEWIVDVYMGAANQAGEDNRDVARMASLLAGLPASVPGATINRLCASGLEAVNTAARAVKLGEGDYYLAGGVESMSRAPWVVPKPERGLPRGEQTMYDTTLGWRLVNPRMAELGVSTESMGETGENVAERYEVSREAQDAFALRSHRRAVDRRGGRPVRRGDRPDRGVRGDARQSRSAPTRARAPTPRRRSSPRLRPVFREGGTVTAGNASTLNDGAACTADRIGGRASSGSAPSRWRGSSPSASPASTPPTWGSAPSEAVPRALAAAGLDLDQIDLIELNEAFASQALACARELGIDEERLNVNGGAIALGHPLGCSGARLTTTLAARAAPPRRSLRRRHPLRRRRPGAGDRLRSAMSAERASAHIWFFAPRAKRETGV